MDTKMYLESVCNSIGKERVNEGKDGRRKKREYKT